MTGKTQKYTIGRDRGCDIAITNDTVSSRHAELSWLGDGKLLLTDCKSRNGTFRVLSDGRELRIHQELVSPHDRLRFGDVRLGMSELLEALRLKYPNSGVGVGAPSTPAGPSTSSAPSPPRQGSGTCDLERCECGAVKPVRQRCPVCGAKAS
jgi:pSer/pThr/pTyr-binding forkhead associated (FHA) protein